jgi:linoleoyl-CoA desaturase
MTLASSRPAAQPLKDPVASTLPIAKQRSVKSLPFTGQQGFRKTLNQRVDAFVKAKGLQTRDIPAMYAKTGIVLAWWAISYALYLYAGVNWHWSLAILFSASFGLAVACIGFNIMHDSNHGGYSNNPRINRILGYSCELIGLSTFIWRQQHNVWHHTYTNIAGMDEGLETDGWLRSSPKDVWSPKHRFQHLYAPLVYAMAGIGLLIFRNYSVYFTGKSSEHFVYPKMSRADHITFWLGRIFNIILYVVLPFALLPWPLAVAGFLTFTLVTGTVFAHVLMLAHIHDGLAFAEPVGDPLHIENEWAVHQVITTMNFSPKNALINWYVGGLNYQIEHHLFPQLCHIVYPQIAPIVRDTCKEFGVAYRSDDSFWHAIFEHYRSLRAFGVNPASF